MIRRQLPAYSPVVPTELWRAVRDVLRSPPSEVAAALERQLAGQYRAERVLLLGSGTQALQLALRECRRRLGDDVVAALPAYGCFDLVTAAIGAGVDVTFYDIDPSSLTPDLGSLRASLSSGARVVVAANLYGFPLDWNAIERETRAVGAFLIEDAAQGLGSSWRGMTSGSWGDVSVLSFGRGKGWNAGGGGALLLRHGTPIPEEPEGVNAGFGAFVRSFALWALGHPWTYGLPASLPWLRLGETRFRDPCPPTAMSTMSAAIASRHRVRSLDATRQRLAWAVRWEVALQEGQPLCRPCSPVFGGTSGYLRFPVVATDEDARDRFVDETVHHGSAAGYPTLLPDLPAAQSIVRHRHDEYTGASILVQRLLTLPTHPRVAHRDLKLASPSRPSL